MPFEIPENWVWTTIEDIAESNIGLTYKPTDICANGVPVYRSNNIQNRRICLKELVRVNTNILEKQYLQEGDLLICARNGSRNLVGKCALIDNLNEPTSFGAFMAVCRSALNPWIFQILNSEYFNTYLDDSNSTAINQVTQKMLLAFQLPIPPAAEQERIISKLKQWYEYIDEIEDRKIELESYIKQTKSKILDLAISGKLVPQDPNDEPAIELLKRINPDFKPCDNSHYENLPQGWELVSLNSIVDIISGVSYAKSDIKENGVRILRGGNIQDGEIICLEDDVFIDQSYSNIVNSVVKGDIVLVASTGSPTLIGKTGYARITYPDTQIGAFLRIIRPKTSEISAYLNLIFNSDFYKNYIRSLAKGTNINNVKNGYIEQLEVALPPIQEQERIVKMVENIFISLDNITAGLL